MNKRRQTFCWGRQRVIATAVAGACLAAGNVSAFEIDTGNPDIAMRWDNTLRYNAAMRTQSRDPKIANYYAADEGDALFNRGDMVANRLDLLTEFDFTYKKDYGFRVSAAGWYDAAYSDHGKANTSAPVPPALANVKLAGKNFQNPGPSYINNEYSSYTKRYYQGPSGEVLDAFVFANFDIGSTPVKLKAGRHNVFWGESLFLNGVMHGIAYSQMPLDLQKGFATPGVEAKELFRPLNQISGQVQLTNTLSLAAQYFLQWEAFRYPEGGTYLGPVDFAFNGPDRVLVGSLPTGLPGAFAPLSGAPLGYTRGDAIKPDNRNGEFGVAARWSPDALDGTLGFYYRRYADKMPQAIVTNLKLVPTTTLPLAANSTYNLLYTKDIDLFGISFTKNIGGVSVGSELSYRHNTPLSAKLFSFTPSAPGSSIGLDEGPTGDTLHFLVNAMGTMSKNALFDVGNWAVELTGMRLQKVNSHPELFNGVGYGGCSFALAGKAVGGKSDGCATKNYVGIGASFTPTWYQVLPGVDLSMPLTYSVGLSGNAATTFAGNEGLGNYTVGLGADIYQKYRVDLKYISYFGNFNSTTVNGLPVVTTQNGFTAMLADRGFLSLTLKTSF